MFAVTQGKERRIVGKLMNRKLKKKRVQGSSLGDQDTKENSKHLSIISFELVASPKTSQTRYYLRQLARYVNPLKHSGNYTYVH